MPRRKREEKLSQSEQVERGPWLRVCNACNEMREDVGRCETCGCPEFRMMAMVEINRTPRAAG